ncbi:hypothetical protein [Duganella sacchari]|uniref:hypothetical protein n=1 Tax=Duganella sacchari TaxID=551987 RepID=UPI0009325BCD|nr:hypothetical protein [Duganella sacchari]
MLKRYFVAHEDSISMWEPAYVTAISPAAAVREYLRKIYSKDSDFREHVCDLRYVDAFVGGLVYPTAEEQIAFMDGVRNESPELTRRRVQEFFSQCPEHGETFLKYIDTEDVSVITEAVYEYIAAQDPSGVIAIEEDKIRVLS